MQSCASTARKAESRPAAAPLLDADSTLPGRALTGRAPCYPAARLVDPLHSAVKPPDSSVAIHMWGGWRCAEPLAARSAAAGVTRMGGNRVSGFRRAAVFGRAIARDPSPKGEGAAQT